MRHKRRVLGTALADGITVDRKDDGPVEIIMANGEKQLFGRLVVDVAEATWLRDALTYMLRPPRLPRA